MSFVKFKEQTITLGANEETHRAFTGSFVRVLASTADFEMGVSQREWLSGFTGLAIAGDIDPLTGNRDRFERLWFKETQGAPNTIKVIVGDGQVLDDRVVFGGAAVPVSFDGPQPVSQSGVWNVGQASPNAWRSPSPDTLTTYANAVIAAATAVSVMAASASRVTAVISNRGTEMIWLRSEATVVGEGLPVPPGETVRLHTQDQIFAANTSNVSVLLSLQDEVWA